MDAFVLDQNLNTINMIETYESFIWTERYFTRGDFEFEAYATMGLLNLLQTDRLLHIADSKELMLIEEVYTFEDEFDDEKVKIRARGHTADVITDSRLVPPGYNPDPANAGTLIYDLLQHVCVDGRGLYSDDVIPRLQTPRTGGPGRYVGPEFKVSAIGQVIKELCAVSDMGFRFLHDPETKRLTADVYFGRRRGTSFSPELDNLAKTSFLETTANYYNVAYVYSETHRLTVRAPDLPNSPRGYNRRVIHVDATDIETSDSNYEDRLTTRGLEVLNEHRKASAFDGLIDPNGRYIYGDHFSLGDTVALSDGYGHASRSRVTEYIRVNDREGYRAYPTFTPVSEE